MAYAQKLPSYISPQDYLLLEEHATTKHEYLDGVIYDWQGGGPKAMAGGSKEHNRVSANAYVAIRTQLMGGPCDVFIADVRVAATDDSAYFYPDVVVSCSAADKANPLAVKEPCVVVEVLSLSTELFDRGDKFKAYRAFDSLEAYVLISPERRTIEVFTRGNGWLAASDGASTGQASGEPLQLGALGLQLNANDVFEGL